MRRNVWNPLFILITFGLTCSCQPSTEARKAEHRSEPESPEKSLDPFWREFQSALAKNDVAGITRLTRFPIDCNLADVEGFEGIRNREGFGRNFGTIFPKQAVRTLLTTRSLPEDEGDAESWTICHNEPNEISEMEWSIIYRFSRLPDGSIRLTAVEFAG